LIDGVDPSARIVLLRLNTGQQVRVDLPDLKVTDMLAWSGKKRVLEPGCKGIYAFYQGDYESAVSLLKQSSDFPQASWYLERIALARSRADEARQAESRSLQQALDEVEQALEAEKWESGLARLDQARKQYRATPAWSEMKRRAASLRESLEALGRRTQQREELNRLFSVPFEVLQGDRIKVSYPFFSKKELDDFTALGSAWQIAQEALICSAATGQENRDYYHNQVGVRFGAPFDPAAPMSLRFRYRPPVEGIGPVFMGLSFFGGCFGIRSFEEGAESGQVNFWTGDLDGYGDYFFVPQFGETKSRKGRIQSFGFQRGERYEIELLWTPGEELLLRIDGKDIYRAKAFKPLGAGMEIKTLHSAVIDSMTVEGQIKGA
jgi:hypothetical protein